VESLTESPRSSLMRYKGNAAGGRIYTPPLKENGTVPVSSPPIDTDFVRPYITQSER